MLARCSTLLIMIDPHYTRTTGAEPGCPKVILETWADTRGVCGTLFLRRLIDKLFGRKRRAKRNKDASIYPMF
jgi:hypothetical protein